jgi:hypothetical protein
VATIRARRDGFMPAKSTNKNGGLMAAVLVTVR